MHISLYQYSTYYRCHTIYHDIISFPVLSVKQFVCSIFFDEEMKTLTVFPLLLKTNPTYYKLVFLYQKDPSVSKLIVQHFLKIFCKVSRTKSSQLLPPTKHMKCCFCEMS